MEEHASLRWLQVAAARPPKHKPRAATLPAGGSTLNALIGFSFLLRLSLALDKPLDGGGFAVELEAVEVEGDLGGVGAF